MPFFLRAAFVAVLSAFTLSAVGDELLDEARALLERKLPEDCSYEELREFETAISDLTEREASRKEKSRRKSGSKERQKKDRKKNT